VFPRPPSGIYSSRRSVSFKRRGRNPQWRLDGLPTVRRCAACLGSILTGHMRSLLSALAVLVVSLRNGACRFREAAPDDLTVLHSRSCARKTPPPTIHPRIIQRIVEMRESPPEHLQRVPGPKALLYYLPRDAELQALGAPLPRSTRTIWKILRQNGCILDEPTRRRKPQELREPLEEVQLDAERCVHCPCRPAISKQQHVVEVLNFVDAGTSILLSAQVHQDFHAETADRGRSCSFGECMACLPC
jgi:hypothetical protein